jgi:hypothetical protein
MWLDDEPGALGNAATALGSIGVDVVGIEVLERDGGRAIDELDVTAAAEVTVDRLVGVLRALRGVAVEDVRLIGVDRGDRGVAAVALAGQIACAVAPLGALTGGAAQLHDADAVAVVHADGRVEAAVGELTDSAWLASFLDGVQHLAADSRTLPGDVAWAPLSSGNGWPAVVATRRGRPFHARERQELIALAQVAGAAAGSPRPAHQRADQVV